MRAGQILAPGATALWLASVGCGFLNDVDGPAGVVIRRFQLSPREVSAGTASTLQWEVEGAEEVSIDNGVGTVKSKGSVEVKPGRTTSYTLTARGAGASASATVQLVVAVAQPSPSPSPTPRPSASPNGASACGAPVGSVQGCAVTFERPRALAAGECLEITRLALSQGCPMAPGGARAISFEVMAETQLPQLRWRKQAGSHDRLEPSEGHLLSHGATTAIASQTVQEEALAIELVSGGEVVLVFRLRND